jgi:uncharacterized OsmC-like protein
VLWRDSCPYESAFTTSTAREGKETSAMTTATVAKTVNGVNVEALFKTVDAVRATPGIAKFKFRLGNAWLGGGHNRSTINTFYGVHQENARPAPFTLDADEPPVLLGQDAGPNPVEYLLHALAACVTTSLVYHAAAKGIAIQEVEATVEGHLDLRGFLGIDKTVRNGYERIRMSYRIKADVPDAALDELVRLGPTYSPVFDSVTRGVPVTVTAERL